MRRGGGVVVFPRVSGGISPPRVSAGAIPAPERVERVGGIRVTATAMATAMSRAPRKGRERLYAPQRNETPKKRDARGGENRARAQDPAPRPEKETTRRGGHATDRRPRGRRRRSQPTEETATNKQRDRPRNRGRARTAPRAMRRRNGACASTAPIVPSVRPNRPKGRA